jgi:hypothetical protein
MQVRVATLADAEAITSVINAAFRRAESFFIDRNRVDLEDVRSPSGEGDFPDC